MKTLANVLPCKTPACVGGFVHARAHLLYGVSCCRHSSHGELSTCFLPNGETRDADEETEYRITFYWKGKKTQHILPSCTSSSPLIENIAMYLCLLQAFLAFALLQ